MLGERNLLIGGSVEHAGTLHNGTFLDSVELLGKYDLIAQEHLHKVENKRNSSHYLGPISHNEVIDICNGKSSPERNRL